VFWCDILKFANWIFPISLSLEHDGRLITEALDEIQLSEEKGFHSVWLNEHHFDGTSVFADPVAFSAAVAMCTSTIKIGYAVLQIALHNPVRLAAQCSLIDHLSKGRLIVGLGRGSVANHYEYEGFNVSMDMGAGALEEAEELLIKCWTETDVTHIGEYWRTKFSAIRPATYSKPYPPIIRSAISDNSIRNLARLCRPFLTAGGHPEDIRRKLTLYRKQAAKSGYTESEIESAINGIWFTSDVLVAESTNEAAKIAREHLAIEQKFISDARVKLNSSEWVNSKEGQDLLKHEKLEDGFIYGSVDKVTDQINKLRDAGVNNLMFKVNTGQMDYGVSERTIKLLGDEVMPGFS